MLHAANRCLWLEPRTLEKQVAGPAEDTELTFLHFPDVFISAKERFAGFHPRWSPPGVPDRWPTNLLNKLQLRQSRQAVGSGKL